MPNQSGPIDCLDLCALKAGDLMAWRAAWSSFWAVALQAARHSMAGLLRWEAEDVASDAIEEFIGRIDGVTSVQHAKALLAMIASRRAIDFARRKSADKRRIPTVEESGIHDEFRLSAIERAEMVLLVDKALESLDPETRMLLMEKVGQGFTYREISDRHGMPLGTVCTRVARALARVRATMQQSSGPVKEMRAFLR